MSALANLRGAFALAGLAALILALRAGVLLFDHSLNSIDGALQTWFALNHFADGNQLGSEFQSYLGITMVLALLPAFFVFGQTLFASTLAANLMVVAAAFGAAYATIWLIRAVPKRMRWQASVVLVFGFYYAARLLAESVDLPYPATLDPGVSLRPLRGFLPFLVLPFFVMALRRLLRDGSALSVGFPLGLVAGAGLLWSNDAGVPLVLALTLGLVMAMHRRAGLLAMTLMALGLGIMISAAAILLLTTHGAPGPWLQYNFRDVAGDQFWFFAPWDRSTRILGLADLPNILRHGDWLSTASLIVLIACVLWAMIQRLRGRSAPVRGAAFVFVGSSVIGTALIPQIGGHIGAEYNAITFVLGACAPLIVSQRALARLARPFVRKAGTLKPAVVVGLAALAMVGIEAGRFAAIWAQNDRTVYDAALGFHVTPEYAADLAAMRRLAANWDAQGIPKDRQLLSVYTSPLDIAAGVESPAPVGSLIHALGPDNRADFTALVGERKVAAVTTIAPDYSGWEGWIRRANWPFFRALHAYYAPIARNDQQVLWVLAETAALPAAAATCRISALSRNTLALDITAPAAGLASVTVTRQPPFATGRSAMLTVVETSADTAVKTDRWADFPRYGIGNMASLSLIAPVEDGATTRLTLEVIDGSAIGAATCSAQLYPPVDTAALPALPQGIDRYLAQGAP